ncbi:MULTISPECIES: choline kinase family protein [unclassified Burkholderia]|uniref:choline kinase family protein n=1 Tax=unclassified Burkholderia TaxID=2613784 RepID=UPI002AB03C7E|nr:MULTISPECIES: choline kinase family protein [unclassified Burkholderia]
MKLGQGRTEAELAIESAIAQIGDWSGRSLSYERISAGITNLNWRIRLDDDQSQYFMKLPGAGTEIFIDRIVAHEAAVKAATAGYAPRVVHYLEGQGIEVHEFLEGYRSCNVGDLLDDNIRRNIVLAYKAIHETQTLSLTLTGFDQVEQRLALARQHGARLPRDMDHLLWHCSRARQAIEASGMPLSACFNDSYVTNYMVDAQQNVKLIDWEYASNNDPYWDLALFAFEIFSNADEMGELIEIHDGRLTREAEARVTLYGGVVGIAWGIWAALQARISTIQFDYAKYSELLFLRARHLISQPAWDDALVKV